MPVYLNYFLEEKVEYRMKEFLIGIKALRRCFFSARYKEIIKRLKRLLETERRNLRQVRESALWSWLPIVSAYVT